MTLNQIHVELDVDVIEACGAVLDAPIDMSEYEALVANDGYSGQTCDSSLPAGCEGDAQASVSDAALQANFDEDDLDAEEGC